MSKCARGGIIIVIFQMALGQISQHVFPNLVTLGEWFCFIILDLTFVDHIWMLHPHLNIWTQYALWARRATMCSEQGKADLAHSLFKAIPKLQSTVKANWNHINKSEATEKSHTFLLNIHTKWRKHWLMSWYWFTTLEAKYRLMLGWSGLYLATGQKKSALQGMLPDPEKVLKLVDDGFYIGGWKESASGAGERSSLYFAVLLFLIRIN